MRAMFSYAQMDCPYSSMAKDAAIAGGQKACNVRLISRISFAAGKTQLYSVNSGMPRRHHEMYERTQYSMMDVVDVTSFIPSL
jgi:hypothetical protein